MSLDYRDYERLIEGYKAKNIELEERIKKLEQANTRAWNEKQEMARLLDAEELYNIAYTIEEALDLLKEACKTIEKAKEKQT